tara:strand:+ start:490 stop:996 length:507 start_codon:yes stop_codon:yes gene_type:complete
MEQFLRNYFTNLNPNATEEEILAFLASQGFGGMGDFSGQTSVGTGGITNLRTQIPRQQEFGNDGGINNIITGTGGGFSKPPSKLASFLVGLVAPPVGAAMGLRNLASQGKLPFGLNEVFGDEYTGSGINKEALQKGIEAAESDSPDSAGVSSFDAAVSAGIQAAEDDQ